MSELTREQMIGDIRECVQVASMKPDLSIPQDPNEYISQLRATITQQAQELERVKGELGELKLRLNCPMLAPSCLVCGQVKPFVIAHLEASSIGVCEECRSASQQLTAMTDERDKWKVESEGMREHFEAADRGQDKLRKDLAAMTRERDEAMGHAASMSNDVTHLGEQLAASQARCYYLEEARSQWIEEWRIKTRESNKQLARLEATRSRLEARCREMEAVCTTEHLPMIEKLTEKAVQGMYAEDVAQLQATITGREEGIKQLRQAACWAMAKVKRYAARARDYQRATEFLTHIARMGRKQE